MKYTLILNDKEKNIFYKIECNDFYFIVTSVQNIFKCIYNISFNIEDYQSIIDCIEKRADKLNITETAFLEFSRC